MYHDSRIDSVSTLWATALTINTSLPPLCLRSGQLNNISEYYSHCLFILGVLNPLISYFPESFVLFLHCILQLCKYLIFLDNVRVSACSAKANCKDLLFTSKIKVFVSLKR